MGKRAWLFPGQGAQFVGMGKDLHAASPVARQIYDRADAILGFKLSALCFDGPAERLDTTDVCQPAIFVTSVALAEVWRQGPGKALAADATAGLSLGEYTALWAAGSLSFEDGVRLTRRRGELMQAASDANPSTMVSIMGLDEGAIENICEAASTLGIISPANFNCPGQVVVSGTRAACAKAAELAEAAGGKAIPLSVAGAFHSPLMASAAEGLAAELQRVTVDVPKVPVVANVTGGYHLGDPAGIRKLLVEQLTHSTQWQKSMQQLLADGFSEFIEIGPGRVLKGLMRKIDRQAAVANVNDAASAAG